ncbi:insulinase family protein [Sphingobacterium psychroaquaticum]|uniref:M16 family metallopeptidase n=1 Tax=Sphingobacterium psychroaquaticum TaxID=561061 RepID=UPI00106B4E3B|nr:M16 family metallopeptidase [Sphingobacterium psychroaquaticum]QBQ40398.1 insulinase family protein [Sphingobacterium psychroaquaticum]
MRYTRTVLLLLLGLFQSTVLFGQQLKQDPKLVKGRLKNGLTYYIYPNESGTKQSAIQLFVKAGSLQEEESQRGLAHFVEHMAFNGSKNYPKNEVITYLESLGVKFGADLNAYTSYDQTVYKIDVNTEQPEQLQKAIDIVADWAFELSFDSLEIEKERGVIIEEWRTKQGAAARLSEQYLPLVFYNSRYAQRQPIGTMEVLQNFAHPVIKRFYQDWYRPDLLAIAVVSNQDVRQVEKYIKQQFGRAKQRKNVPNREVYTLPAHVDTLYSIATDKEENDIDFAYITKTPALMRINREAALYEQLLQSFVNGLAKKRFERLQQQNSTYRSGSMTSTNLMPEIGVSLGGAALYEDAIHTGIQEYLYEQARIRQHGFTAIEIADYRQEYVAQYRRNQLNSNGPAPITVLNGMKEDFYEGNILMDRNLRSDMLYRLQQNIDSAAVRNHIESQAVKGNTVVMLTGPDRVKNLLPTEKQLRTWADSIARLDIAPWVDEVNVPEHLLSHVPTAAHIVAQKYIPEIDVHQWTLSNQTNVYLKSSNNRKNHVQLTGFRRGGFSVLDSADYINALFSKDIIAASGAGDFSRRALSKYLAGNSATAMLVWSKYREGVAANANTKDLKTMFELLYLKWTQPRVDRDVFAMQKRKALANLKKQNNSTSGEYNKWIAQKIAADSEEESFDENRLMQELQYDDLLPVFKKRFASAAGFDFVIVGDFQPDSIAPYVLNYLGGLPDQAPLAQDIAPKKLSDGENASIQMVGGDTDKAMVNIIFQQTKMQQQYPAILVYEMLQEVLKVKLRENLREKHSGVYGVSVNISSTAIPSPLFRARISFTCSPQRSDFLVQQVEQEIQQIANQPSYFKAELDNIKKQLILAYDKQKDKETFWSAELRNHLYNGYEDWSYFTRYAEMVEGIQEQDISQAVKQLILEGKTVRAVLVPHSIQTEAKK